MASISTMKLMRAVGKVAEKKGLPCIITPDEVRKELVGSVDYAHLVY